MTKTWEGEMVALTQLFFNTTFVCSARMDRSRVSAHLNRRRASWCSDDDLELPCLLRCAFVAMLLVLIRT